jgi:hypothetical protein
MGYTVGSTLQGIVIDKTNGEIYKVVFSCGNNGTNSRADWGYVSIE